MATASAGTERRSSKGRDSDRDSTGDAVIVSYTGSIEDGEPVVAEEVGGSEGQGQGSQVSGGGQGQEREKSQPSTQGD